MSAHPRRLRRAYAVAATAAASPYAWSVLLLASSIALWLSAMAPRLMAEALFGPICSGHGPGLVLHCPACYAAAAMAGLGVAIAARHLLRRAS